MAGTSLRGAMGKIWIQPGGANNPVYPLSCSDLGDLTDPKGGINLTRCYDNNGKLKVVGQTESAPDPVTTTITSLLFSERSWLESLDCQFALYVLQRCGGKADLFNNYSRGERLEHCRISQLAYSGLVKREEDEDSMLATDIEAWPPLVHIDQLAIIKLGAPIGNEDLVDVVANDDARCTNECGLPELPLGSIVYVITDAPTGAKAELRYSTDFGATWNTPAAQPFAINEDLSAITRVLMGITSVRLIVSKLGDGTAMQGKVAYTDDAGATWNVVNIGGATDGHGAVSTTGLFNLSRQFVFLASAAGYIYKSEDGGETWTAVEDGAITVDDYLSIHFADDTYGIAGAENGIVSLTDDGGETWYVSGSLPGAADIKSVTRLDKVRLWAADVSGKIFYSVDGGESWSQRTGWSGSGVGSIESVRFLDDYSGWMIKTDGVGDSHFLHTFNGGHDWYEVSIPADCTLRAVWPARENLAYLVGTISPIVGSAAANLAVVLRVEIENK